MAKIVKAEKVEFTAGRIAKFQCDDGKTRSYLWCKVVKGLGIIATAAGSKSYIFQAKIHGKSARITIGDVSIWNIPKAQKEARRLQILIDQGSDPRQIKADESSARITANIAKKAQHDRETVTVSQAWGNYLSARKRYWGDRHYNDHVEMMLTGGEKRTRSAKLTDPGVLASLAAVRLIDITPERISEWALVEGTTRAGRARLANRLLKAFLSWCSDQPEYREIVTSNAAKNKNTREILGKPKAMNDVIQREQLSLWFSAVKQIHNPVISAYLQCLLLTGARPNELLSIRWENMDFKWKNITMKDKVEGFRVIPLTPYMGYLIESLPRRNEWVFSSITSQSGRLIDPTPAHVKACNAAGLTMTLYGLRRSFATLSEWIEMPAGIAAQIQGHAPSGVREKHYIRRPLDLLGVWHNKIEAWILEQAGVEFIPVKAGLRAITAT